MKLTISLAGLTLAAVMALPAAARAQQTQDTTGTPNPERAPCTV